MLIPPSKYQFIIFDWDGTLMDSTARIVSATQATARALDIPVPSSQLVKSIIGLSLDKAWEIVFPEANQNQKNDLFEIYRHQYVEGDKTPSPLFAGTIPLLTRLKDNNIKIAIATGKSRHGLNRVLDEVGLMDYFDFSICADESKSKPHPEMIQRLLICGGVNESEVVMVGDSVHDLAMAKKAGVDAVGVTCGANSHQELASHQPLTILDNINQFQSWLDNQARLTHC